MTTQFKTLLSIGISHAYYSDGCLDIDYVVPADTAQLMSNGKLIARSVAGSLVVLFQGDGAGGARSPMPGKKLRFGLTLANPYFTNFTAVDADFTAATQYYRNGAAPTALDPMAKVAMVGQRFSHDLSLPTRPVTVTLTSPAGVVLQSAAVTGAMGTSSVSYDLTGAQPGVYVVAEAYSGSHASTSYYVDPELLSAGAFGVVEVVIDPGFYGTAPTFSIPFAARQETLKYYVVVTNYPAATPSPWAVSDNGSGADGRPQIAFNQVASAAFTPDDIAPSFLGAPTATVVLFQSAATVARSEKAKTSIQLANGGEVLIPNLPQPGQEKTNADMIIAISKPNPSTGT